MIILSRNRVETAWDTELAEALAVNLNAHILSIPFLYDLRSFGPTVQRLREIDEPTICISPLPVRAAENLLGIILGKRSVLTRFVDPRNRSIDTIVRFLDEKKIRNGQPGQVDRVDEPTTKRWYPIIDKNRCTGCLECVNFCLFGVYVIGNGDRPLVDQPDACRDGCPACSRVCPGRAIMFPMHEDRVIAGEIDAEESQTNADTTQAEKERKRHLSNVPDGLDDLVDRIDRFSP